MVKKEGVEVCVDNESGEKVVVHKSRARVGHLARLGNLTTCGEKVSVAKSRTFISYLNI